MEPNLATLIVLMVALLLVSLGLVIYLVRSVRKKKPVKMRSPSSAEDVSSEDEGIEQRTGDPATPVDDFVPEPVEPTPEPRSVTMPPPPAVKSQAHEPAPKSDAVLLMKVWQDNEGFLVVESDGKCYRRLFDIRDGAVGRQLMETINRLVAFSKGQDVRIDPLSTKQTLLPTPSGVGPSSNEIVAEPSFTFLEELEQATNVQPRKARITVDPVPFRRRSEVGQSGITLNLAGEIEQLLQIRVKASPEYSQRYIHVTDSPDGGLRFDVDGVFFSSIDEIHEPGARALIQAAISDWEAKR